MKINKNLKAIIDGKTYTCENGIFFIPINIFKIYKARLYYDGDSEYVKAEPNTSYKLTGNEVYKVSSTADKIIKKFKRFRPTYGKYKVYTVKERLNGRLVSLFRVIKIHCLV